MKNLLIFCALFLAATSLQAQKSHVIKGIISDASMDYRLTGVMVRINDVSTLTDIDGRFEVRLTEAENYVFSANHLGYKPVEKVLEPGTSQVHISMSPKTVMLEEVQVSDEPRFCQPQCCIINDPVKSISQARDLGDFVGDLPGFGFIKKGGFALDPVYRGFKYEQLNVIYDGGMQTTFACPGRMDPTTTHINPQDVKKIELITGPFSVRYGPTMGGILNVVTDNFNHQGKPGIGGSVDAAYESNGDSKMTKLSLHGSNKLADFAILGGLKDYGNYQSGNGTQIPSSFNTYDYNIKTGFNPGKNHRIQLNWRQAFNRDVLHAALPMDTESDDSYFYSLDYSWQPYGPVFQKLQLKAYGTRVEHVMTNELRPNFMMVEAVAAVEAETYGGKLEAMFQPWQNTVVYAGTDLRYVYRDGSRNRLVKRNMMTGEELPMPMSFTDAIWQSSAIMDAGLFTEGRYYLGKNWTFMAGLRLDRVSSTIDEPAADFEAMYDKLNTDNELNFSSTATATYETVSGWNVQFAMGRGVRTANMIERYINHFTVGMDAYEYVGNPELNPEVNHQIELTLGKKSVKHQWSVSAFYSFLSDFITARVDTTLSRKYMGALPHARRFENIDQARMYGFEASGTLMIAKGLQLNSTISYTIAQNLDWDEPLPEIPPLAGTLGLRYEKETWWLDTRGRFVADQERVSTEFNEGRTPGFAVYDIRAGYKPIQFLSIGASLLNVFDRQYRQHMNRSYRNASAPGVVYEPGRNATVFVRFEF